MDWDALVAVSERWTTCSVPEFAALACEVRDTPEIAAMLRGVWHNYPMVQGFLATVVEHMDETVRKGKSPVRLLRRARDEGVHEEFEELLNRHKAWRPTTDPVARGCVVLANMPRTRDAMSTLYQRYESLRPLARVAVRLFDARFL